MIEGYWTALVTIMLVILLMTGWSKWIDERLKLVILIPSVLIIWCAAYFNWNIRVELGYGQLTIYLSFVAVAVLLLLYDMFFHAELDLQLVMLYTAVLCLATVMIRAFTMFAPWAGASIAYWHLPLLSGAALGLLQARFAQLMLIVFCSSCLAELLLIWQQRGEYSGVVGSLQWWDDVVLSVIGIAIVKMLLALLQKWLLYLTRVLGNRMKS